MLEMGIENKQTRLVYFSMENDIKWKLELVVCSNVIMYQMYQISTSATHNIRNFASPYKDVTQYSALD